MSGEGSYSLDPFRTVLFGTPNVQRETEAVVGHPLSLVLLEDTCTISHLGKSRAEVECSRRRLGGIQHRIDRLLDRGDEIGMRYAKVAERL